MQYQFCAKMMVSTLTVFEMSMFNIVVLTRKKERIRKMALSLPRTFAQLLLPLTQQTISFSQALSLAHGAISLINAHYI